MRLFELRPSGNRPRLAFHPRITVIRGLEDDGVEDLKLVLQMLAAGVTTVCDGTVEVHGVLISLKAAARLVGPSVGEPVIAPIEDVLPPVPGPPRGGPGDPVVASTPKRSRPVTRSRSRSPIWPGNWPPQPIGAMTCKHGCAPRALESIVNSPSISISRTASCAKRPASELSIPT